MLLSKIKKHFQKPLMTCSTDAEGFARILKAHFLHLLPRNCWKRNKTDCMNELAKYFYSLHYTVQSNFDERSTRSRKLCERFHIVGLNRFEEFTFRTYLEQNHFIKSH